MFYLKSIEEYDFALTRNLIGYESSYQLFMDTYNLFKEYKPFETYNLGFLRGSFLELLTYKYLKLINDPGTIHQESKIKINEYESHYWDIIVKLEELLKVYECKFSSEHIKRDDLNKMYGLHNKIPNSKIYLVTFELKEIITDDLNNLIQETKVNKFNKMLNSFNYIYLEDYVKNNPFE